MVYMYNHNRVLYEKPLAVLARDLEELWANEPESVDPWLPTGTALEGDPHAKLKTTGRMSKDG